MNRKSLFFVFLFQISLVSAQSVYVEYEAITNLEGLPLQKHFTTLLGNGNKSIFTIYSQVIKNEAISNDIEEKLNEEGISEYIITDVTDVGNMGVIYKNKSSDTLKLAYKHSGKNIVINDVGVDFDWKILNETKLIENFKCYKAITSFRGRNFVAWFTNDIPISDGPNKYGGLPGLIISIYDETGSFQWNAKHIKYSVSINNKSKVFDFIKTNHKSYLMREFVEEQTQNLVKKHKMMTSKMSTVTSNSSERTTTRKGLELIYEWETQGKESVIKN